MDVRGRPRENVVHYGPWALLLQGHAFWPEERGATYQRLVNVMMFKDQIERNIEVYVDDMLVKSWKAADQLDDLEETSRVKLNPRKCSFKVFSSKFLGFMVSQRGIEAK
jgi:hypothetical protein